MNDTGYFESLEDVTEEKQAAAQGLINALSSDRLEHTRIVHAVKILRRAVDHCAERVAKERADWHDDPSAENHAGFHAPAIKQYPREIRDLAALMLVDYQLSELSLQESQK